MEIQITPIDENDHYLIYRPLLGLAFIGNQAMADFCLEGKNASPSQNNNKYPDIMKFLSDIGFYLPENKPYSPDHIQSTAVLLLTNQCQLKCIYCYAAAGENAAKSLSIESGKKVIDFVFQQAKTHHLPKFTVDFHGGGEPSLEWNLLQQLIQFAKSKSIPAKISLTSNAIWSDRQLNWIIQNIDRLSVSMDGNPETQNFQRPFQNKKPSFDIVFSNLQKMDVAGFSYGIRMTVCSPWSSLKENVSFISENTKCRSLQVEPAFNLERGSHAQPNENQYHQFAEAFLEAYDTALEYGTHLLFSGSRPGMTSNVFCSAPYNAIVINPDDDIVACYEITNSTHPLAEMSTFGHLDKGTISINHEKKLAFYAMLQERLEMTCKDCFCRWTCAGDCYTRAFYQKSDYLSSSERCVMNQEITRHTILTLITKNDGIWQSDSLQNQIRKVRLGK